MEKIKRGKKGVSALIATVLLVLITVAGIGIIWGFVKPLLTPDDSTLVCMDAELTINAEEGYTWYNSEKNASNDANTNISLQVLAGSKTDLKDMMIRVVSSGKMTTKTLSEGGVKPATILGPNEGEVYQIVLVGNTTVTSASVAAILKGTAGKDVICPMSAAVSIPKLSDL